MKKISFVILACASCRLLHRSAPDAGIDETTTTHVSDTTHTPSTLASTLHIEEDEEEPIALPDAGKCPLEIHPGYCRRRCRDFEQRKRTMHARRIGRSLRSGIGTCGTLKVFAEEQNDGDGGVAGSIVEFYDEHDELVAAVDSRQKPCGTYGTIPKCTPVVTWGATK